MDTRMFARLGAVVFVAIAITAAAIEMTRKGEAPVPPATARPGGAGLDPLREELHRCALLGEAGGRDPGCLAAWARNRARFLAPKPGTSSSQEAR
ncbi:UNVERIFIED_ORG: conjugative transfer region protein TrbK [Xanthobacter viscosus]|uniref:Conjugal transfer protein TrbK n=1 Tax=Xanthobacter autotrophicus TaxID=280 RepID=A0A6C1KAM0_XANAU|nr:putative entry exclusion protein TrbK-alt [Xanthobacter autotrophicus]TLX41359.1 conjugal transfer protein TrbK [Xanthobacter autotrophicus]